MHGTENAEVARYFGRSTHPQRALAAGTFMLDSRDLSESEKNFWTWCSSTESGGQLNPQWTYIS